MAKSNLQTFCQAIDDYNASVAHEDRIAFDATTVRQLHGVAISDLTAQLGEPAKQIIARDCVIHLWPPNTSRTNGYAAMETDRSTFITWRGARSAG